METIIKKEKNAAVVSVKGKMDAVSSPEFQKQLLELIDRGEKHFVLDLGELEYISSIGLRTILEVVDDLKQKEGSLFLCAMKDLVREVFDISGFETVIPVYDSVDSALSHIQ